MSFTTQFSLSSQFLIKPLLVGITVIGMSSVNAETLSGENRIDKTLTDLNNNIAAGSAYTNYQWLTNPNSLQNEGQFFNREVFKNEGQVDNYAELYNTGLFENESRSLLNNEGVMVNSNLMYNRGIFNNYGSFGNEGEFFNSKSIGRGGYVGGIIHNFALFGIGESGEVVGSAYTQNTMGASTVVNGLLQQASVDINGGVLKGSGRIQSDVTVNGSSVHDLATLAPGNSIDTLTIDGNYTQGEFGVMSIEFDSTSIDRLDITGLATLGGVLEFSFIGGDISTGSFNFLNFGSISGAFDEVYLPTFTGYDFELEYGTTFANLVISETVSAVPEPSTYALMLAGLGLVGFMAARRRV